MVNRTNWKVGKDKLKKHRKGVEKRALNKTIRDAARYVMRQQHICGSPTSHLTLSTLEKLAGIETRGKFMKRLAMCVHTLNPDLIGVAPLSTQQKRDDVNKYQQFYTSYAWRRLRMETIKRYGPVCMCCHADDVVIHVDHIKPLRKYWELRLDPDNVQILCEVCNHGKGNWDETDWRQLLQT